MLNRRELLARLGIGAGLSVASVPLTIPQCLTTAAGLRCFAVDILGAEYEADTIFSTPIPDGGSTVRFTVSATSKLPRPKKGVVMTGLAVYGDAITTGKIYRNFDRVVKWDDSDLYVTFQWI